MTHGHHPRALAWGFALRAIRAAELRVGQTSHRTVEDLLDVGFRATLVILHWSSSWSRWRSWPSSPGSSASRVPAVHQPRRVRLAVLLALTLQTVYYLVRIWIGSRFTPWQFLRGGPMRS